MSKVITGATMSLDGFIAGPNDSGFDLLFQWYGNGDVEIGSASPDVPPSRVSAPSAELIKREYGEIGALVVGRHLYDFTNAWGGRHPIDVTTVVLTHKRPDDRPEAAAGAPDPGPGGAHDPEHPDRPDHEER